MSITQAIFEAHQLFQNFIPFPYIFDKSEFQLIQNSRFFQPFQKRFRIFLQLIISTVLLIILYRLFWLFFNWKTYTVHHLIEGVACFIGLTLIIMQMAFCYTLETKWDTMIYADNQIFQIDKVEHKGQMQDYLVRPVVYGTCIQVCSTPLFALVAPLFMNFEPIQGTFGDSIPIKILVSCTYGLIFAYGATQVLTVMLSGLAFLEHLIRYTKKLHYNRSNTSAVNEIPMKEFYKCQRRFVISRMMTYIGNQNAELVYIVLIFMGVLLITCTSYATIKMYDQLPGFTYLAMPTTTVLGYVIAMVFTGLAYIPRKNAQEFRDFWKNYVRKREAKMMLRAAPAIGFALGPYGSVTSQLGLTICEDYVTNTVDLLLIV